jgi:hypothetical protein
MRESSREAASDFSPGRQPWVKLIMNISPERATEILPPLSGLDHHGVP